MFLTFFLHPFCFPMKRFTLVALIIDINCTSRSELLFFGEAFHLTFEALQALQAPKQTGRPRLASAEG